MPVINLTGAFTSVSQVLSSANESSRPTNSINSWSRALRFELIGRGRGVVALPGGVLSECKNFQSSLDAAAGLHSSLTLTYVSFENDFPPEGFSGPSFLNFTGCASGDRLGISRMPTCRLFGSPT